MSEKRLKSPPYTHTQFMQYPPPPPTHTHHTQPLSTHCPTVATLATAWFITRDSRNRTHAPFSAALLRTTSHPTPDLLLVSRSATDFCSEPALCLVPLNATRS